MHFIESAARQNEEAFTEVHPIHLLMLGKGSGLHEKSEKMGAALSTRLF